MVGAPAPLGSCTEGKQIHLKQPLEVASFTLGLLYNLSAVTEVHWIILLTYHANIAFCILALCFALAFSLPIQSNLDSS